MQQSHSLSCKASLHVYPDPVPVPVGQGGTADRRRGMPKPAASMWLYSDTDPSLLSCCLSAHHPNMTSSLADSSGLHAASAHTAVAVQQLQPPFDDKHGAVVCCMHSHVWLHAQAPYALASPATAWLLQDSAVTQAQHSCRGSLFARQQALATSCTSQHPQHTNQTGTHSITCATRQPYAPCCLLPAAPLLRASPAGQQHSRAPCPAAA